MDQNSYVDTDTEDGGAVFDQTPFGKWFGTDDFVSGDMPLDMLAPETVRAEREGH